MTGHKLTLKKREVDVKDGKIVRKTTMWAGKKKREADREAKAWLGKSKTPAG